MKIGSTVPEIKKEPTDYFWYKFPNKTYKLTKKRHYNITNGHLRFYKHRFNFKLNLNFISIDTDDHYNERQRIHFFLHKVFDIRILHVNILNRYFIILFYALVCQESTSGEVFYVVNALKRRN